MDATTATEWVTFLREAGGWGIALVEAGVIVFLWKRLEQKDAKLFGLLDRTNDILMLIQGKEPQHRLPPPRRAGDGETP